jgi:putative transposase
MQAVEPAATELGGTKAACEALGVSRASYYRYRAPRRERPPRPKPPRSLSGQERQVVLDTLNDERFVDRPPAQVFATLLDQHVYLCSVRTMYRILEVNDQVKERRNQLRHPNYAKPELLATAPNQLWSWDITKLKGPVKWSYFYLYVVLDVFSRYVVAWLLAEQESSQLAKRLLEQAFENENIQPGDLTLHADRGSSMKSHTLAQLLADLGVTKTHSRPHVPDDNPFSESQFKTMKYRPEFPNRCGSMEDGLAFARPFFHWYNNEHHHSALGFLTPAQVHHGLGDDVLAHRREVLERAFHEHPERFPGGLPRPTTPPREVWINPPATTTEEEQPSSQVTIKTLTKTDSEPLIKVASK